MASRRINDAQVDRLLAALKSLPYRQELAARIAKQEGISYKSAMRRLQRYVTDAGEKRNFARSPKPYQQQTRQIARRVPVPLDIVVPPPPPLPPPKPITPGPLADVYKPVRSWFDEHPESTPPIRRPEARYVTTWDLQAIVLYHDGNVQEAADVLGLSPRGESILDVAVSDEQGLDVWALRGAGELVEPVRDFFEDVDDKRDLEDIIDLLANLPAWHIGVWMQDLQEGNITFADLLDAWRADGMIYREFGSSDSYDLTESEYWALWREAYARSKR